MFRTQCILQLLLHIIAIVHYLLTEKGFVQPTMPHHTPYLYC